MRIKFAVLLLASLSQFAMAEAKYGMAGCGLGAMAFGTQAPVFAATTNDVSFQSFAISSGTSNCQEDPHMAAVHAQQKFFVDNLDVLSKEMAQGDGKYVRALASTLGCNEKGQSVFGPQMQKAYSQIFDAPGSNAMLNRVRNLVQENKELSNNCHDAVI